MAEYHLDLPLTDFSVEELKVGDQVFLSGIIGTGRDHVHKRIVEYSHHKKVLPSAFSIFSKGAIYHMGPIVKQKSDGRYSIISGGPTTSDRMNSLQEEVCRILNLRFVIGKGGMTGVPWSTLSAVYLQYPGGAGALVSKFIQSIENVEWLDLGTPEAVWILRVKDFGPLTVTIDTHKGNLYVRREC